MPIRDLEPWAKDALYVNTEIALDWRDRLRVLFGRRLHVRTVTNCENLPGRAETTEVRIHAARIFPQRQRLEMGDAEREVNHEL